MKLPLPASRLVENRSDERDVFKLVNQIRDQVVNQRAEYFTEVGTTDVTTTVAWSDTIPADSVGDVRMEVVGQTPAGQVATYERRLAFRRVGTGAVAFVGAGADIIGVDKEDVAGWDVGFALDAAVPDTLYAYVIGAAATVIAWRAHVQILVSPWS